MDLSKAKAQFDVLLKSIDQSVALPFLKWVQATADDAIREMDVSNEDKCIEEIKEEIRSELPQTAILPSENITFPTVGLNSDCDSKTTVHVDAFLYSEEDIDELCDAGKMSRQFCQDCGSHNTAPLTFISHSISQTALKYLFQYLLPNLQGLSVLDVGSRLGAVLYGAYYYSGARSITGVEMNKDLCHLQEKVIEKYQLQDRIKLICADICTQTGELAAADVIVLHNVFDFFMSVETQERIWHCLRDCIRRPGVLLVTSPSLELATQHLQVSLAGWVEEVDTSDTLRTAELQLYGSSPHEDSDFKDICFYKVK